MLHSTCLKAHSVISGCRTQETERGACKQAHSLYIAMKKNTFCLCLR